MAANEAVAPTNNRLPTLLDPQDHTRRLHGSIQDVIGLQFAAPLPADQLIVGPTEDPWRSGKRPPSAHPRF